MSNHLNPVAYQPLPLGAIRPQGWLRRQLQIQADGLSGHLDEFWPDVKNSRWFGGEAEGWERAPYWLDGVLPLAHLLDDAALKKRVNTYLNYILTHQSEDGWLGPRQSFIQAREQTKMDIWSLFLALKVLVQHHDATGDARVEEAVRRCLAKIDRHIDHNPLFDWGQFRWFETLIALYWLYERSPEPWLLELAAKLHAQGFNWGAFFQRWPYTDRAETGRWSQMSHVVNNAMALKAHALWWRVSGEESDREAVHTMLEKLDRYHGMVTGVFTGDENLAGLNPTQGTELCAVVEYMYSLEILLSVLGNAAFGDRLEKITFNALPATFSPDMWAHQYDQQVNQVQCSINPHHHWTTNGPESNVFGLEPNYGCCTANLSQGWPKFAAHLWMKTQDGGLAAVAHAPSSVATTLNGQAVTIELETDYPFGDTLHYTVHTESPISFPLELRIPAWAEGATLTLDGETISVQTGGFHRIQRSWQGTTSFTLTLPMQPRLQSRPRGAVAVEHGPLVYALPIGEDWRQVNQDQPHREPPHADWEVHPTTAWNYALAASNFSVQRQPVGERPFSPDGAPVALVTTGKRIPHWQINAGSAEWLEGPVSSTEAPEAIRLIPYGCTNLRVAEFPTVN